MESIIYGALVGSGAFFMLMIIAALAIYSTKSPEEGDSIGYDEMDDIVEKAKEVNVHYKCRHELEQEAKDDFDKEC